MLTNGLDGVMTIASAPVERLAQATRSACGRCPLEGDAPERGLALPPHEIVLEVERAFVGVDDAAHRIVGHRRDGMRDAEPLRQQRRHLRQCAAGGQRTGPQNMRGQIAVAELEPGLAAELLQRRHEIPGLAGEPQPRSGSFRSASA